MFAAFAAAMNSSDIAARAMLMPPEAEPVMPASTVTVTASLTSGLGIALSAAETAAKPGNRRLAAIRELCKHGTPGKEEHCRYTKEQRALDCPYGCHRTNLRNDRM